MKIVLQRVKQASVKVNDEEIARINKGLCLLVGVEKGDSKDDARYLSKKAAGLRIFPDGEGKMNLSVQDIQGEALAVSQFTLAGSIKKGRRPSFDNAESPEKAKELFGIFVQFLRDQGIPVSTGRFGALMQVDLTNDGPVTFIL